MSPTSRCVLVVLALLGASPVFASAGPEDEPTPPMQLAFSTYVGGTESDSFTAVAVDAEGRLYVAGHGRGGFPGGVDSASEGAFVARMSPADGAVELVTFIATGRLSEVRALAVGPDGSVYAAGHAGSGELAPVNASQPTSGGWTDGFVARLAPGGGSVVYATYLGGSGFDSANGIAVDPAGRATVVGLTDSKDFPTFDASQPIAGGSRDGFVARLTPEGALERSTYLGGSSADEANGVAVDAEGRAHVVGSTESRNFPGRSTSSSGRDGFVVRLDDRGSRVGTVFLAGSSVDSAAAAAVTPGGVVVAGSTMSSDLVGAGASLGGLDAFVAWVTDAGVERARLLGGSGYDAAYAVAVDGAGVAHVVGLTNSVEFPSRGTLRAHGGLSDGFLVALLPDTGGVTHATLLGGAGHESARAVAIDAGGRRVVAGHTASPDFPLWRPAEETLASYQDAFVLAVAPGCEPASLTTDLTTAGTVGNAGWYRDLTLRFPVHHPCPVTTHHVVDGVASTGRTRALPDGVLAVDYWSEAADGQVEPPRRIEFKVDGTRPNVTVDVACPVPAAIPGSSWCRAAAHANATAEDATSGLSSFTCRGSSGWGSCTGVVLGEGNHLFRALATDVAGNVAERVRSVPVDWTPPDVALELNGTIGRVGWYLSPVDVRISGADNLDSHPDFFFEAGGARSPGRAHVFAAEGVHAARGVGVDAAGNEGAIDLTLRIDVTPPESRVAVHGVAGDGGWWRSDVNVSFHSTDALSGALDTRSALGDAPLELAPSRRIEGDGVHRVRFSGEDLAGNVEPEREALVLVDATPPATTVVATPATPGAWSRGPVELAFSAADATSGVRATLASVDGAPAESASTLVVGEDGDHEVRYWSLDAAGNSDAVHVLAVRVDAAPPATTADLDGVSGDVGWWRSAVNVTLAATDSASGVASTRYSLDGGPWTNGTRVVVETDGEHVVRYRSVDVAGNEEAERAVSVRVDATPPELVVASPVEGGVYAGGRPLAHPVPMPLGLSRPESPTHDAVAFGRLPVDAHAEDSGSGVAGLRLLVDGVELAHSTATRLQHEWNGSRESVGEHVFLVRAMDAAGNLAEVELIVLNVSAYLP